MEMLQSEAESCDNAKGYQKTCMTYLSALLKRHRSLPPLFINDVTCLDSDPVSGNIYRGHLGTRLLRLKVLRMFLGCDITAKGPFCLLPRTYQVKILATNDLRCLADFGSAVAAESPLTDRASYLSVKHVKARERLPQKARWCLLRIFDTRHHHIHPLLLVYDIYSTPTKFKTSSRTMRVVDQERSEHIWRTRKTTISLRRGFAGKQSYEELGEIKTYNGQTRRVVKADLAEGPENGTAGRNPRKFGMVLLESDIADGNDQTDICTPGCFKNAGRRSGSSLLTVDIASKDALVSKTKFAVVWKGVLDKRSVAVKVSRRETDDERSDEIFFKHFRRRSTLNHANILNFLGLNLETFAPNLSIITPWMANGNVISYLKSHPGHDRLSTIAQFAAGIAYLHSFQPPIIHGNIKGSNILITNDLQCTITDFGLPISTHEPSQPTSRDLQREYLVGSFRWLPPETINQEAAGTALETPRDIYAFACTVLEIMTGEHPFVEIPFDPAVVVAVARGKRPAKPSKPMQGWCPQNIWKLVESCWDQDPVQRPTADTIHRYLEELITARKQGSSGWELFPFSRELPVVRVSPLPCRRSEKRFTKEGLSVNSNDEKGYLPHEVRLTYSCLFTLAQKELAKDPEGSEDLRGMLRSQETFRRNAVQGIIHGHRFREKIFELLHDATLTNPAEMYQAVVRDEARVASHVEEVLSSRSEMLCAESLSEEDAECFMDALQEILDSKEGRHSNSLRQRIHSLLVTLCKRSTKLPESMFVTGVKLVRDRSVCCGAFADVYRGIFREQHVALKRLRFFRGNQAMLCSKFCREAAVWRRFHHRYVMPFIGIDAETFPRQPCMVSPWMFNGTITDFLNKRTKVDVDRLLLEVCEGIEYLHSQNVVHGDIKGANVLIDDDRHPRLADFGLATFVDSVGQSATQQGGTLRWMAPELLSFSGECIRRTFASDIYAFGCLVVEVYTGRPPFSDVSHDTQVLCKIYRGERPDRPCNMSDSLWNLVQACWHQKSECRPSAEHVVHELRAIVST
ncbi:hypothetical protein VNI00_003727 [Paramarasmius palmivorus]|uniref:Protein kinase domain-containing protein n=1 Tax=Paramarasmius palmivorus TaxID=297713 RepID=A0AAW0DPR0_9AGAR